jgi:hypothetical protein
MLQFMKRRASVLIALTVVASVGLTVSASALSQFAAAATKIPLCQSSQLKISTASAPGHRKNVGSSVHLYFTNIGRTCDLLGTEPGVQAVTGKSHLPVGTGTTNDLMMRPAITLKRGQHSRSTLIVVTISGSIATRCKPVMTDGILVGDGLPYSSSRYAPLVLRGVCSSPDVGNLADSYYSKAAG